MEQKEKGNPGHKFTLTWDKATLQLQNGSTLTIPYHSTTHLPMVIGYKKAVKVAEGLAMTGCITNETNQNLTFWGKWLLRWHFKLGHLGFAATQWIGRQGILGISGTKWGSTKVLHPKCAACLFGKQQCTPTKTKNTKPIPQKEGILKRNKL